MPDLFRIIGPGVVTGASDTDPSSIGTFTQVGSQFGYGALWMPILMLPLAAAVQELCARIALETGAGLGVSLRRRFPGWLVGPAVVGLFVANTINLGADLGAVAAGVDLILRDRLPRWGLVIAVGAGVLALQLALSYGRMIGVLRWLSLVVCSYLVAGFLSSPNWRLMLAATFVPHVQLSAPYLMARVAVLGTTISPYMFFWQASSEADEMRSAGFLRRTLRHYLGRRRLAHMRADVLVGLLLAQLVAYSIVLAAAATLHDAGQTDVQTAEQAARALERVGGAASSLWALGIIGTGLLAIPILSGSAAYALKEFFDFRGDLSLKPSFAPAFYVVIGLSIFIGVGINLLGVDTIRALFLSAVINGVLAPPLLILIVVMGAGAGITGPALSHRAGLALAGLAAALMACAAVGLIVLAATGR